MVDNDKMQGYEELLEKLGKAVPELTHLVDKLVDNQETIKKRLDKISGVLFFGNGRSALTSRVEAMEREVKNIAKDVSDLEQKALNREAQADSMERINKSGRWKLMIALVSSGAALITTLITALM